MLVIKKGEGREKKKRGNIYIFLSFFFFSFSLKKKGISLYQTLLLQLVYTQKNTLIEAFTRKNCDLLFFKKNYFFEKIIVTDFGSVYKNWGSLFFSPLFFEREREGEG